MHCADNDKELLSKNSEVVAPDHCWSVPRTVQERKKRKGDDSEGKRWMREERASKLGPEAAKGYHLTTTPTVLYLRSNPAVNFEESATRARWKICQSGNASASPFPA